MPDAEVKLKAAPGIACDGIAYIHSQWSDNSVIAQTNSGPGMPVGATGKRPLRDITRIGKCNHANRLGRPNADLG